VALFTVREQMKIDPAGTLRAIAGMGYRYVETALWPSVADAGLQQSSAYAPTYLVTGNRAAWGADVLPEEFTGSRRRWRGEMNLSDFVERSDHRLRINRVRAPGARTTEHDATPGAVVAKEEVVELDVAVSQPRSMRDVERRQELLHELDGLRRREKAPLPQLLAQRVPGQERHDEEG
jgi:hypothetical protein